MCRLAPHRLLFGGFGLGWDVASLDGFGREVGEVATLLHPSGQSLRLPHCTCLLHAVQCSARQSDATSLPLPGFTPTLAPRLPARCSSTHTHTHTLLFCLSTLSGVAGNE